MKVWNYMMIMLTMMVFLYFMGFSPAGTSSVLEEAGIVINATTGELVTGDISNSDWFELLFSLEGLIIIAGLSTALVVGLFTRQFNWKLVLVGFFTSFTIQFISFGWSIVSLARDTGETWLVGIVATVFLPITVMFVFSIVEWFGGAD